MSLKSIKSKIRSVGKTHKVTHAMEAVSAVKMRKSQERALSSRPYSLSALRILKRVSGSIDAHGHPLLNERDVKKVLILIITSDKGLAGSLNISVLKKASSYIDSLNIPQESVSVITIGNKAYDYFTTRGFRVIKNNANMGDTVSVEEMKEITKEMTNLFTERQVDLCTLFYTTFISTFEQEAVERKVLPLSVAELTKTVESILPTKGMHSPEKNGEEKQNASVYTLEPSAEEILIELLPFLINIEVYHSLLEAKASEHSARMVAMKKASDKAEEMSKELTLEFNKERQALITREVSEIIGGSLV